VVEGCGHPAIEAEPERAPVTGSTFPIALRGSGGGGTIPAHRPPAASPASSAS
jgi:hypothetical protein